MARRVFVDTNVILYADDVSAGAKRTKALEILKNLITRDTAVVSTQVLQEYFVNATRKLGVSPEVARRKVDALSQLNLVILQREHVLGAVDLHTLHPLSFWDALIVKAASAAGCRCVLSEDMAAGQTFDGVLIENPFE